MRHSVFAAALSGAALFVLAPTPASAQPAATVQSSAGDNGIRIGEGRLHPYGEVDTHYVVNPGRLSGSTLSDGYVALKAGLDYELKSPQIELTFSGEGSRNQYFSETQFNGWNADVGADLVGYKDGPVEFRVNAGFIRSQMPANQTIVQTVDHNDILAGGGITVRPGGGALTLSGDVNYYEQFYDEDAENQQVLGPEPAIFNQRRISPSLRAGWKFLPKTSVFVEAKMDIARYPQDEANQNFPSENLATAIGLSGALTPRISILIKAGYGDPFTDDSSSFIPVVGQGTVGYYISETSKFQVGILRQVTPQPIFAYVAENKVYANYDQQVGAVQVSFAAEAGLFEYGRQTTADRDRQDTGARVTLALNYPMNDWLTLGLSETFEVRGSNSEEIVLLGAPANRDFGYTNNDLFLRLSARY